MTRQQYQKACHDFRAEARRMWVENGFSYDGINLREIAERVGFPMPYRADSRAFAQTALAFWRERGSLSIEGGNLSTEDVITGYRALKSITAPPDLP